MAAVLLYNNTSGMCRRLCIRQLSVSMMLYVERDAPGAESCRELDGEKLVSFLNTASMGRI
jgi:hypothetical protein